MSELFSNQRLIDYFYIFDVDVISFDSKENAELLDRLFQPFSTISQIPLKVSYNYKVLKMYPKIYYTGTDSHYTVNVDSIFLMLPEEHVYLTKRDNEFFSLIFTKENGGYYYGFFLKVFTQLGKSHRIYSESQELGKSDLSVYSPKYICFLSQHPFFISFKSLLEEIYAQSKINHSKCYKVENILSILLYRMYLPKYEATQLSFILNEKVYTFSSAQFPSEISFRLLFSYLSIENVVMLIIAIMMNSVIVFIHSNLEIIAPILNLLMQLIFPFQSNYSIVTNLNPDQVELMGFYAGMIVGVYRYDFADLSEVMTENQSNVVYIDIDEKVLIIDNNEHLKENKNLPIQRIKNLIDNLYKYADILPKEESTFQEMKSKNIWDIFKSENVYSSLDEYRKVNKAKLKKYSSDGNLRIGCNAFHKEFSDMQIRCLFFDFFLQLFESYDEGKHYIIDESTQSKTFNTAQFIQDSKDDIRAFLEYLKGMPLLESFIQNVNHIVDQRHKEMMRTQKTKTKVNPRLNEALIVKNFNRTYEIFSSGLERRKRGKSLEKLFKVKIFNTITISSPSYEVLAYKQNNIFVDPMHEEIFKHNCSIPFYKHKIEFQLINFRMEEQNTLNKNLLKEEMNSFKEDDKYTLYQNQKKNVCDCGENNSKNMRDNSKNIREICTMLSNQLMNFDLMSPMTVEFRNLMANHAEIIKRFFGILPSSSMKPKEMRQIRSSEEMTEGIGRGSVEVIRQHNSTNDLTPKSEYINSFNFFIQNLQYKGEFHMNFGINLIQTVSYCSYCNRPSNIWDIRKEFEFCKTRNETRTKCKFCSRYFVPYFYVLEHGKMSSAGRKGMNTSFVDYINDESNLYKESLVTQNTKILRRVEYMCFDHIMATYSELATQEKTVNKRFPYSLYYNICLLMGEIKVIIEKEPRFETLDSFLHRYVTLNRDILDNPKQGVDKRSQGFSSSLKNSNDPHRTFREGQYLKSLNEITLTSRKTKTEYNNQVYDMISRKPRIQLDLKDLISDRKYEKFQRILLHERPLGKSVSSEKKIEKKSSNSIQKV